MFKKNKEVIQLPPDYKSWEQDFGFLLVVLNRQKELTKTFYFSVYSDQLQNNDYITDDPVTENINSAVVSVLNMISPAYRNFLTTKYFSSDDELIRFITEDIYHDFVTTAIKLNNERIRKQVEASNIAKTLSNLNK